MPVPGRKPKPAGQAINRNKPTTDWIEVVDEPFDGKRPRLPATRWASTMAGPVEVPVKPMTRQWWKAISTMPHCRLWTASDWAFALSTAMVADAAFCGGIGAATELRNREKVLGTTVDYRRDLRIRYVEAEQPELAVVTALDEYRDL